MPPKSHVHRAARSTASCRDVACYVSTICCSDAIIPSIEGGSPMSNAERTVTIVVIVIVGLAASLLIAPPVVWVLGGLLVVLTGVGTDHVVHTHWRVHLRRKRYTATIWILPGMLVCGAFLFLRLLVFS